MTTNLRTRHYPAGRVDLRGSPAPRPVPRGAAEKTTADPGAVTEATIAVVRRFNEESFQRHDVDALMADMTDDCVFELVAPAEKGGGRWEGQAAVRAFWESLESAFPGYASVVDDLFAIGDRCACRWTLRWDLPQGGQGVIRGVDILTMRAGKIAVKLTYFTA